MDNNDNYAGIACLATLGCWVFSITQFGWMGLFLGWIPSVIVGALWPFALIALFFFWKG